MSWLSLEMAFSVFGMMMVLVGMAGSKRVKVVSIEVGPLQTGWRVMSVAIGLLTMAAVGWVHLSK